MYETFGFIINFTNLFFRYNKFEANITNAIIFKTNKSFLEVIENSIYNFNWIWVMDDNLSQWLM